MTNFQMIFILDVSCIFRLFLFILPKERPSSLGKEAIEMGDSTV